MTPTRFQRYFLVGAVLAAMAAAPTRAMAQVTPLGASTPAAAGVLNKLAYDDKHDVYLQVWEYNRVLLGRFVGLNGALLGQQFVVGTYTQSFAGKPKVAYSRGNGVDAFLVTYVSDVNRFDRGSNIFGQLVQYTGSGATGGQLIGGPIFISPFSNTSARIQVANDVIYNPITSEFVVAYEEAFSDGAEVYLRRISANGTPLADAVDVSVGPGGVGGQGGQGGATLSMDWAQNRILCAFNGDNPFNPAQLGLFGHIVDGSTLALVGAQIAIFPGYAIEQAAVFLPERAGFLVTWTGFSPDRDVIGRFVTTATQSLDPIYAVAARPGVNEGGAGLDYDYVSRSVLVAMMADPKYLDGVVLTGLGLPASAIFRLATTVPVNGSFFPSINASDNGVYGAGYINDYSLAYVERFALAPAATPGPSFAGGGGAPPPPPGGDPHAEIHVETPGSNGLLVPNPFTLQGWAIDTHPGNGAGISRMDIWAVPYGGSDPIFIGSPYMSIERPDVAQAKGERFRYSGFSSAFGHLAPGRYTLLFYPQSQATGQVDFAHVESREIVVASGALTYVDQPAWAQMVGGGAVGLTISGWALDLNNLWNAGVDAVHIYAINANTGQTIPLGPATMWQFRPDLGAAFGHPRFNYAGFLFINYVPLPPGTYYIATYSHSAGQPFLNVPRLTAIIVVN